MSENPYAAPQADASPPPLQTRVSGRSSPYGPYREIGWLHITIVTLLVGGIAIAASQIITILQINEILVTFDFEAEDQSDLNRIETLENTSQIISGFNILTTLCTMIFWGIWKNKSCKNAWLFYTRNGFQRGASSEPPTPGWSVGFYFIPILNLWKPFQAMAFIRDQVTPHVKTGLLLGLWWVSWIVWTIYSRVSSRLEEDVFTIEGAIAHNERVILGAVIFSVASILAAMVIHLLSVGQKRSYKVVETQKSRPRVEPTAQNGWKHGLPPL